MPTLRHRYKLKFMPWLPVILIFQLLLTAHIAVASSQGRGQFNILVIPYMYSSLADAVAHAKPGDIILVASPVSLERDLTISKPLAIISLKPSKALINLDEKSIIIRSPNVKIYGITFKQGRLAIEAANVMLADIYMENCELIISNAQNVTILGLIAKWSTLKMSNVFDVKILHSLFYNSLRPWIKLIEIHASQNITFSNVTFVSLERNPITLDKKSITIDGSADIRICDSNFALAKPSDPYIGRIDIISSSNIVLCRDFILRSDMRVSSSDSVIIANSIIADSLLYTLDSVVNFTGNIINCIGNYFLNSGIIYLKNNVIICDKKYIDLSGGYNPYVIVGPNDFYTTKVYLPRGYKISWNLTLYPDYVSKIADIIGVREYPLPGCPQYTLSILILQGGKYVGGGYISFGGEVGYAWQVVPLTNTGVLRLKLKVQFTRPEGSIGLIVWNGTPVYPLPVRYNFSMAKALEYTLLRVKADVNVSVEYGAIEGSRRVIFYRSVRLLLPGTVYVEYVVDFDHATSNITVYDADGRRVAEFSGIGIPRNAISNTVWSGIEGRYVTVKIEFFEYRLRRKPLGISLNLPGLDEASIKAAIENSGARLYAYVKPNVLAALENITTPKISVKEEYVTVTRTITLANTVTRTVTKQLSAEPASEVWQMPQVGLERIRAGEYRSEGYADLIVVLAATLASLTLIWRRALAA